MFVAFPDEDDREVYGEVLGQHMSPRTGSIVLLIKFPSGELREEHAERCKVVGPKTRARILKNWRAREKRAGL